MPQSGDVVGIEMCQQHNVQILRTDPARLQLLVDRHALGDVRLIQRREMFRQHRAHSLGVVHALGADVAAPAGVHKDEPVRMLNEIGTDRQRDALPGKNLSGAVFQADAVSERNGRGDLHIAAV